MAASSDKDDLVEKHLSLVQAIARKVKRTLGARDRGRRPGRLRPQGPGRGRGTLRRPRRRRVHHLRLLPHPRRDVRRHPRDGLVLARRLRPLPRRGARQRVLAAARPIARARRARRIPTRPGARSATPAETLAGVAEVLSGVATIHITSLEAASRVADESLPAPDAAVDTRRLSRRVREALTTLPEKERQLMELYYFGEKNLEEAGAAAGPVEVLGLPAARARRRPAAPGDGRRPRLNTQPARRGAEEAGMRVRSGRRAVRRHHAATTSRSAAGRSARGRSPRVLGERVGQRPRAAPRHATAAAGNRRPHQRRNRRGAGGAAGPSPVRALLERTLGAERRVDTLLAAAARGKTFSPARAARAPGDACSATRRRSRSSRARPTSWSAPSSRRWAPRCEVVRPTKRMAAG